MGDTNIELDTIEEEIPIPGKPRRVSGPKIVHIYDTRTAEPSKVLSGDVLKRKLLLKRDDGSSVFTDAKPPFEPKRGKFKCLLHSSDPNREHYDSQGFAVCPKNNLNSPFQVRRHMEKRHKSEWGAIEQERIDAERKEDRELQRELMSKALGKEEAPLYVSQKDKKKSK